MTMVGVWFYKVCTMLWLMSSPYDNGLSKVLESVRMYHALTAVIA